MALRVATMLPNELVAAIARPADPSVGESIGKVVISDQGDFSLADVWIEFAAPEATPQSIERAQKAKRPLLICTTGLSKETLAQAEVAADSIALMVAPNTSLGVAVLAAAMRLALKALPDYACELVELHHEKKRDAPSGTALRLAEEVRAARPHTKIVTGRAGDAGPRGENELGVFAVRGGGVIGEHTVYLLGEHERIELVHRAQSRDLFAHGAIVAARWLAQQKPGAYRIEHCLEIA